MTQFSRWKIIGYAAAIFVVGGISGGAFGVYEARTRALQPRDRDVALRIRDRLKNRLGLTPEQVGKVDPIITKAASDLHGIRQETMERVNKVFEDSYARISAVLTPEQKAKLDQMQRERHEQLRLRENEGGHWREGMHRGPGGNAGSPGSQL